MPPKGKKRKPAPPTESDFSDQPIRGLGRMQTLGEMVSFSYLDRPFKNPAFKSTNRRTKNLKVILGQERERERAERERRRVARDMAMDVDGASAPVEEEIATYTSIEAPPSLLPQRHYCDITGLEAPYTDPRTGLRYHDMSVYNLIKNLNPSIAKNYLHARGVNPIIK